MFLGTNLTSFWSKSSSNPDFLCGSTKQAPPGTPSGSSRIVILIPYGTHIGTPSTTLQWSPSRQVITQQLLSGPMMIPGIFGVRLDGTHAGMPLGPSSSQWYPSAQVMIAQVSEREFKLAASASESGVRAGVVAVGTPLGGPGVKTENGAHLAV
jgi:hypothetical protein